MSVILFVETKEYSNEAPVPSVKVGNPVVYFDGNKVYLHTLELIGNKNPVPLVTGSDIFNGVEAMRNLNVPTIYVVRLLQYEDMYAVIGQS